MTGSEASCRASWYDVVSISPKEHEMNARICLEILLKGKKKTKWEAFQAFRESKRDLEQTYRLLIAACKDEHEKARLPAAVEHIVSYTSGALSH